MSSNETIQIVSREESIRNIMALVKDTAPGQWDFGPMDAATHEEALEFFRINLGFSDETQVWCVAVDAMSSGGGMTVMITGNGPHSRGNARFVANCREAIQWLIQELNTETIARAMLSKALIESFEQGYGGSAERGIAALRSYVQYGTPEGHPAHLQPTREGASVILAYLGQLEGGTDAQES